MFVLVIDGSHGMPLSNILTKQVSGTDSSLVNFLSGRICDLGEKEPLRFCLGVTVFQTGEHSSDSLISEVEQLIFRGEKVFQRKNILP